MLKYLPLFILICCIELRAQNLVAEEFSGNARLPTAELYDIKEDIKGNKWVASDIGIIKISGIDIRIFNEESGLPENVVLKITIDNQQRIWGIGLKGILFFIYNDSVQIPTISNYHTLFNSVPMVRALSKDKNGQLLISFSTPRVITLRLIQLRDKNYIAHIDSNYFDISNACNDVIASSKNTVRIHNKSFDLPSASGEANLDARRTCGSMTNNTFFLTFENIVVIIQHQKIVNVTRLPSVILSSAYINKNLLIGTRGRGVFIIDSNFNVTQLIGEIDKLSISRIFCDKQKIIWFTSIEKGLFLVKSIKISLKYITANTIYHLIKDNNDLVAITGRNEVIKINSENSYPLKIWLPPKEIIASVYRIDSLGKNWFVLSNNGLFIISGNSKKKLAAHFYHSVIRINQHKFVFLGRNSVLMYNFPSSCKTLDAPNRIMSGIRLSDTSLLITTMNNGIYLFTTLENKSNFKHLILNNRINDIEPVGQNSYAVGSNTDGLLLITGKRITPLSPKVRINFVLRWHHLFMAASKNGLYVWDSISRTTQFYHSKNYLPVQNITGMQLVENVLYVSGTHKVIAIPFDFFKETRTPLDIKLDGITVNNTFYDSSINYKKSSLFTFYIRNNNYLLSDNISYRVNVYNDDELVSFYNTTSKAVKLALPEGNNRIEIIAIDGSSNKTSNKITCNIIIQKPFYKNGYFIWLIILFSLMILYLIFNFIIKKVKLAERKKRENLKKINALKLELLRSQLNPHFIFNSLNSLRDILLNDSPVKADEYLNKFSLLMRRLLNNSINDFTSVASDLDFLLLYIDLEIIRYDTVVTVTVDCPQNVSRLGIPAGLAQPVVENIFKHAWPNMSVQKEISIQYKELANSIIMSIKDNGIGMNPSFTKINIGLSIVESRLRLLYPHNIEQCINIISTPNNGTLIELTIPKIPYE